ncbi:MAG: enoyl-CoA hydratase family protein [Armatimonadetes bacterium]|nr:enoyl-CoA hydratase family protein [Armatimonadota bacterium]
MSTDLLYAVQDGIATFTFNRPQRLNAITFEIYADLRDRLAALQRDDAVKAVVITGAGKGFCSGGDVHDIIGELLTRDAAARLEFTRMTVACVRHMAAMEKPIIAAVNGMAAGAGAVIALASDLRIASPDARFAFLFTKVGLSGADMGAAYLLPKVVGLGRAMELLLFGDTIDAATAERYGLVNAVVPAEQLLSTAREWALRLARGPSLALGLTKRMVHHEMAMDLERALEAEAHAQAILLGGEDHRIFYEAFKKKEEPRFIGR